MERCFFWLILFLIVILYDIYLEHQYIFIYYTIQTFVLEIFYFITVCLTKLNCPKAVYWKRQLFDIVFAPAIVVCIGFWIVIAPTKINGPKPQNGVFIAVTHGLNIIALFDEMMSIRSEALWKPLLYTFLYNLFLIAYVGAGGRSISGKLPYWYCEYDKPVGWTFAFLGIFAVGVIHASLSNNVPKVRNVVHVV